jgi:phosphatidylserine decarboxylase
MKYKGNARKAAFKIILLSLIAVLAVWAIGAFTVTAAAVIAAIAIAITPFLVIIWILFSVFTLYFFRDPEARPPAGANLILAPGHGKVDYIDSINEPEFMGGECQRVSIFLSVIDIHVQNAPVSGTVAFFKYTTGQFLNALKAASAVHNENVLLGFEASEPRGQKVGVRLIAGVLARRIVPFVKGGEAVDRGQRISLIQFGSRADVYLPRGAIIKIKLGDRVVGGRTVLAEFGQSTPA